jgi:hydroxyethylthiazole kinase
MRIMNRITGEALAEYAGILGTLRAKKPLVHHITNYVTVNDCANITLAIGAAPIMADAAEEAGGIAGISSSLVLNIGTLNARTVESMILAGRGANDAGIPVIFDPVGAGASKLRNDATERILREIRVSVLRGNISEAGFILGTGGGAKGVDASDSDLGGDAGRMAAELSGKLGCVVAITGAVDAVAGGKRTVLIENGHEFLSRVTGTGCMCSSLVGSFCGASPKKLFEAAAAAIVTMGAAGEIAFERAGHIGTGAFHTAIIDAASGMAEAEFIRRAKLYEA